MIELSKKVSQEIDIQMNKWIDSESRMFDKIHTLSIQFSILSQTTNPDHQILLASHYGITVKGVRRCFRKKRGEDRKAFLMARVRTVRLLGQWFKSMLDHLNKIVK